MSPSFDPKQLESEFHQAIQSLALSEELRFEPYLKYLELLNQWNRAYNLTAIRDPGQMLTQHVIESLAVLPYVQANRCLDVGTGAGVPGLILAIAMPLYEWVLLDSNIKKARFVTQVMLELKLENVSVINSRLEDFKPEQPFNTVISRGFASLIKFYEVGKHLLDKNGKLLAMKPGFPEEELAELHKCTDKVQVHQLNIPSLAQDRYLIEVLPARDF